MYSPGPSSNVNVRVNVPAETAAVLALETEPEATVVLSALIVSQPRFGVRTHRLQKAKLPSGSPTSPLIVIVWPTVRWDESVKTAVGARLAEVVMVASADATVPFALVIKHRKRVPFIQLGTSVILRVAVSAPEKIP